MNFYTLLFILTITAVGVFINLLFVAAPYGRHTRKGWGMMIDNQLGWILMEAVSPLAFTYFFLYGSNDKTFLLYLFFSLWLLHYINRSLIFPLRTRTKGKKMPLTIMFSALFFNLVNGYINGFYLGNLAPAYSNDWFFDFRFISGAVLFFTGFLINLQSDEILLKLRKADENTYKIPQGGLYTFISCPNYLGEIVEWIGFALLTWSPAAWVFVIWTTANLVPRAISHHQWYKNNFADYPKERKAILPLIL